VTYGLCEAWSLECQEPVYARFVETDNEPSDFIEDKLSDCYFKKEFLHGISSFNTNSLCSLFY
jgi:hypothetical protein